MERRLLQIAIAFAACVPVFGGLAGVIGGAAAFNLAWTPNGDSHVRYLSGLLLGIGLVFWGCVRGIERRGVVVRVLCAIVLVGGLSRLAGMAVNGDPGAMHWALVMELGVTPLLGL